MISRIKYLIALEGLSEKALGARVGVSQQLMNHYLAGRNRMPVAVVIRILEEFPHISAEWLMRGEGDVRKKTDAELMGTMTKVYEELLNDRDKRIRELEKKIAEKKLGVG